MKPGMFAGVMSIGIIAGTVVLALLLAPLLHGPTFQVGDCISIHEFDHNPYRVTAAGERGYEVEFVRRPGKRHGLSFFGAHSSYHLSTVPECITTKEAS